MTDLLAKARCGRLAALEQRGKADLIRQAVERHATARRATVVHFQSRRAAMIA
ncbi:MAG: hypothetical protein ACK4RN_17650 [Pseudorhodobacter sp.]